MHVFVGEPCSGHPHSGAMSGPEPPPEREDGEEQGDAKLPELHSIHQGTAAQMKIFYALVWRTAPFAQNGVDGCLAPLREQLYYSDECWCWLVQGQS